jgi:hypothetical protein
VGGVDAKRHPSLVGHLLREGLHSLGKLLWVWDDRTVPAPLSEWPAIVDVKRSVAVCVCACVRARARVRVCARACVSTIARLW